MLSTKGTCFVHQFPLERGGLFFFLSGADIFGTSSLSSSPPYFNKEKPQFHCSAFFELSLIFTVLHLVSGWCQQIFQPTWLQPEQVCLEIVSFRKSGGHILCLRVNHFHPSNAPHPLSMHHLSKPDVVVFHLHTLSPVTALATVPPP